MKNDRADRRVLRTRGLVLDAFLGLMVERGYEAMTVQHLLDRSGVGRATFYAHFKGKEDLLASSVRRLQGGLREAWRQTAAEQGGAQRPLGFARAFFRHVDGHRRIYDLMIGRPSEVTIDRYMRRMLDELIREDLLSRPGARRGSRGLEVAVQFVTGAMWSLVSWWIVTRARLSADELHGHFERLALQGLDGALGPAPVRAARR
jgi:AcrR family transcriptional regulator